MTLYMIQAYRTDPENLGGTVTMGSKSSEYANFLKGRGQRGGTGGKMRLPRRR